MNQEIASETQIAELHSAFRTFTSATATLEREFRTLQDQAHELRLQLDDKHRALMQSLERQRRLEVQALRQGRLAAMGEMAAMLAHEVRNPLGAMELFARLLLDEVRDRPEASRLGEQVTRGIQDLNHLVTNILEYARLPEPDLCVVSVAGVVDDALRVVDPLLGSAVRVERRSTGAGAWLLDRALLGQALVNLLRNACDAMAGPGVLSVDVAADDDRLRIVVIDSGPGVPPGSEASIFDPFFTTKARGTGLGLAVARAAVASHGGTLALEPSSSGARFAITLPAGQVALPALETSRAGRPSPSALEEGTWNAF